MNKTIDNLIDNAQRTFINGCWEKFKDYYSEISNRGIFIFGTGIYGKFLFNALTYIGYGEAIKAFLNDFASEGELLFDKPVLKPLCTDIDKKNDVVVIGVQKCEQIVEYMNMNDFAYILADEDQWFYQNNLMYTVYRCIKVSAISDMVSKIENYYRNMYGRDEEILELYEEAFSKNVIRNRLMLYRTGDCKYIDETIKSSQEYFDDGYYSINDKEVYIDVGAFDGDSIRAFVDFSGGKYSGILGIEPDSISYKKLEHTVEKYHDCAVLHCATGEHNSYARFDSKGVLGSSFNETGEEVEIRKLDDILLDIHPTLIKLDIEGAELDTLKGATGIIKRDRPKLAICIYHKMEDIIEIPQYIHELVPEYKFKVRQHSNSMLDTVLYAEM